MDARAWEVDDVLQFKRLGMFRLELSAGASGSLDTLTCDGQDLIGGAVNFDTSLAATAAAIAAAINARTNTTGFQAVAAILDTNSEVVVYQTIPGAAGTPAVAFTVTTITADIVYPAAETDNEIWGDTDSWVSAEDIALASDDLGARYIMRVNPSFSKGQPKYLQHKGGSPAFVQAPVNVGTVTHYKLDNSNLASSVVKPSTQYTLFNTQPELLPVYGGDSREWVVAVEVTDVFTPKAMLLYG